jgi:hypothetical protein
VGKGRQIAGVIYEHHQIGKRRFLWVSVSSDLQHDACRDLEDVRHGTTFAQLPVYPKDGTFPPSHHVHLDKANMGDGVLFCTYSLLMAGTKERLSDWQQKAQEKERQESRVSDTATGNLGGEEDELLEKELGELVAPGTRLLQIINWLKAGSSAAEADCVIVLDEAHKAKKFSENVNAKTRQPQQQPQRKRAAFSKKGGGSTPHAHPSAHFPGEDLRKLTMADLKRALLTLGVSEPAVDILRRWDRVAMVRELRQQPADQSSVVAAQNRRRRRQQEEEDEDEEEEEEEDGGGEEGDEDEEEEEGLDLLETSPGVQSRWRAGLEEAQETRKRKKRYSSQKAGTTSKFQRMRTAMAITQRTHCPHTSKTALCVIALQRALPKARVMYCSATGASEPESLSYMRRLGSFGFGSTGKMLAAVKKHGMGAMELFAMGLKVCVVTITCV